MSETNNLKDTLILRDYLAADRTHLSNERTFLAYIRTSLALFITGVSFLKFFESIILEVLAYIHIVVSAGVLIYSTIKFIKKKRSITHRISSMFGINR